MIINRFGETMKNKDRHIVQGVDTTGFNFGVKKHLLKKVATAEEIKSFMALVRERDEARRNRNWTYMQNQPVDSQLRGYRKYWRTKYTDGFDHGLYVCKATLRWEVGKVVGKFGTTWQGSQIDKGTLLMYIRHDELGNVELMPVGSDDLMKISRGAAASHHFIKKGEDSE